ncbi:MAG: type IV toxin-antitoxin system AbiEi family antitoxin [Spirochaetales bacterium]|nr:type IV toxin-antitoxin system AbiEi family antitoxin [Spirochaetales bacterium]
MSRVKPSNINQLLLNWEKNSYKTSKELSELGYSAQLISRYKKSGWLESPSKGVYEVKGQNVGWEGALFALQKGLKYPLYPGGLLSLELEGYSHYLSMGRRRVFLYGMSVKDLPLWFRKLTIRENIIICSRSFLKKIDLPYSTRRFGDFNLEISTPELAYLEMLEMVPGEIDFAEAGYISENLTMLRSSILQELLEKSNSVKVNRLALYLAEFHNHDWFKKLNVDKIRLGSGKRVIESGGRLDLKYNITVPLLPVEEEPYV